MQECKIYVTELLRRNGLSHELENIFLSMVLPHTPINLNHGGLIVRYYHKVCLF